MNASSPPAYRRTSPGIGRGVQSATLVVVAVIVLLTLTALTAPAAAAENDSTAPTLTGGERVNATTIEVIVTDDTDVDEGSIDADDFSISDGFVRSVDANESGSNATVELYLDNGLNTDEVTVSVTSDASITDAAGNRLTSGSVTVTGMDSYVPQLREYEVERVNETAARIVVRSTERLSSLQFAIRGPVGANLTKADFRAVDDNTFGIPYVTTHRFPTDGVYTLGVTSMVDEAGRLVNLSRDRTFVRDGSEPNADLRGPRHLETGDLGRFDGAGSTDNVGVARHEWRVDGADAGNGTALERAFDDPGTHEVSLTVVDEGGNNATANWSVEVHDAPSKRGVTVTETNTSGRQFAVSTNRTDERVRVADDYGRLAGDDDVSIRSVTVTLPTNETLRLNVSGNETATSFADDTGNEALTAVAIEHRDENVTDPTFRFAVSASRLSRAGISYSDVALYRDDGTWTELPTEVVRATKSTVVYEAESPGLSTFVVGASGAENGWEGSGESEDSHSDADVSVTDATLVTESVAFGEYAVVEATLTNEGSERGGFVAGVTVGPSVVDTRPVTVEPGETRTLSFAVQALQGGTVAVNGSVAGELAVTGGTPTADGPTATQQPSNASDGDGDGGGFDVPIPNPLALWPGGLVGTVLQAVVGLVVGVYAVLKALAIYLGY